MLTSGELERVSMALDTPMRQMEMRIMSDIVRRIRETGELTASADWQVNRLIQSGMSMTEIKGAVADALGYSEEEVQAIFTAAVKEGYIRDRRLYEQAGKVFIPFEENAELQQLLGAVTAQTNVTLKNITQSLGFAQRGADGHISFTPLTDYYQKILDGAVLDIASGAFDYNTVLKRAVREMTDSGLRTVDYATGWSNRVDVAARRAIMTGMNQLTAKINEDNAQLLDTEWFEISWHSGARPSHWWGGKWFTRKQLETVCGLGDVTGLCGANCYHDYSPVIPGISVPTYTDDELAEMNRREQEPVEWNGRKYTKYEALQRQRRLETTMRAQRQEMQLLKEGSASEDDLINCRARYRGTSDEYARFSKAMGLPQQRERVSADGLGNIMQGKYKGGSGKESPVSVPPVGAKVTNKVTAEERKELLSRNPVDISEKGGIIEEKEELPRKMKSGSNTVDWSIVQSEEYSKKYTKLSDDERVSSAIETRAKWALNNRDGKNTEELYAISLKDGREVSRITDQNYDSAVKRTSKFTRELNAADESGEEILLLHNHPRGLPPSISDINALLKNKNVSGITVGHNGSIYRYTRPNKEIPLDEWNIAMKHFKEFSETTAMEKSLEILSRKFEFIFEKI